MDDATVCLSFDFDAVSPWIHVEDVEESEATVETIGTVAAHARA